MNKCEFCINEGTIITSTGYLCGSCLESMNVISPKETSEQISMKSSKNRISIESPVAYKVNQLIQQQVKENGLQTNNISDGYHTFGELYKHRFHLYIALCKSIQEGDRSEYGFSEYTVIRSRIHKDGLNVYSDWKMFLLMMVNNETGEQISYHLDNEYWEKCDFAKTELIATREWDGHTDEDVLDRLLKI